MSNFGYCEKCCYEHSCTNFVYMYVFNYLGYIPEYLPGSYDNSMFNLFKIKV